MTDGVAVAMWRDSRCDAAAEVASVAAPNSANPLSMTGYASRSLTGLKWLIK